MTMPSPLLPRCSASQSPEVTSRSQTGRKQSRRLEHDVGRHRTHRSQYGTPVDLDMVLLLRPWTLRTARRASGRPLSANECGNLCRRLRKVTRKGFRLRAAMRVGIWPRHTSVSTRNAVGSPSGLRASGSALLLDVVRGLVATRSASFDAERSEKADADDAGTGRTDNGEPVARVGEPHEQKRGNHDRRRQRKDDPPEDS